MPYTLGGTVKIGAPKVHGLFACTMPMSYWN
jgi:hypothetical protein